LNTWWSLVEVVVGLLNLMCAEAEALVACFKPLVFLWRLALL
jgi:hypothetical protein